MAKPHQQHAEMLSFGGLVQQWLVQPACIICMEPDQLSLLWRPGGESVVSSQTTIDKVSLLSIVQRAFITHEDSLYRSVIISHSMHRF